MHATTDIAVNTLMLTNNSFNANYTSLGGGGVWCASGNVILSGNTFVSNYAALYGAGGAYCGWANANQAGNYASSTVILTNNTFTANFAAEYAVCGMRGPTEAQNPLTLLVLTM